MSNRTLAVTDALYDYLLAETGREPQVMRELREETMTMPRAMMLSSPEAAQFMGLLAKLMGARRCLEIGTFTGYSALAVMLALPADARLICCDIDAEVTSVARRYWEKAGIADRIDLRIGPALETLDKLLAGGGEGSFDFSFIDADKTSYDAYYERSLKLLRKGGLILIDNVLWSGSVADPKDQSASTVALRTLNRKMRDDQRIDFSLLPIGDGISLAVKR